MVSKRGSQGCLLIGGRVSWLSVRAKVVRALRLKDEVVPLLQASFR